MGYLPPTPDLYNKSHLVEFLHEEFSIDSLPTTSGDTGGGASATLSGGSLVLTTGNVDNNEMYASAALSPWVAEDSVLLKTRIGFDANYASALMSWFVGFGLTAGANNIVDNTGELAAGAWVGFLKKKTTAGVFAVARASGSTAPTVILDFIPAASKKYDLELRVEYFGSLARVTWGAGEVGLPGTTGSGPVVRTLNLATPTHPTIPPFYRVEDLGTIAAPHISLGAKTGTTVSEIISFEYLTFAKTR